MSTENIMYIEIDQKKEFENFVRFLEREFKCEGLVKLASLKEKNPPVTTTDELKLDEPKLEPEVVPVSLEEDSDHIESDSEPSLMTEAGGGGGGGVSQQKFTRCEKCPDYKTKRRSLLLKHENNSVGKSLKTRKTSDDTRSSLTAS